MLRQKGQPVRRCSFCGKERDHDRRLVAGPGVAICDECVGLCGQILRDSVAARSVARPGSQPSDHDLSEMPVEVILEGLRRRSTGIDKAEQELQDAVSMLRERGVTWARIGQALGVSRQSAWERYSG